MASGIFVSYLRCSTVRQGISGLGLDAQRASIRTFLNGGDWTLAAEFVEVESGRSDTRPEMAKALARCRVLGATLIVANVSRLTRSMAFLSRILETKVDVRFCDLPEIEGPTGRFMLQQMAAVAELEAGMIGDRTRKALAAAKARGQKLGGLRSNSATLHEAGTAVSSAVRSAKADVYAIALADSIDQAKKNALKIREAKATEAGEVPEVDVTEADKEREAPHVTLQEIANELNKMGIKTARGGQWSPVQVSRVLDRMPVKTAVVEPKPRPHKGLPRTMNRRSPENIAKDTSP